MDNGLHLTIDGFGEATKLNDATYIYKFLEGLPLKIGMKALMPPYVIIYDKAADDAENGITGFVVIAESHISIHTFPEKKEGPYLTFDVYSCKGFEPKEVIDMVKEWFELRRSKINVLERGINT